MDKFAVVCALILLGLFMVYVINNNVTNPKPTVQDATLSLGSVTPTPSQNQPLNLTPSPTYKTNNVSNEVTAVIKTERGDIEIALYSKETPNTVANFVNKAKSGFYNNLVFHRVEDWVVQGGDPLGNGTGGGNMPIEFNNKPFIIGSLGVASRGDGKVQNDAQIFITKKDSQFLNGQYTNFGIVKSGMDVVNKVEIGDKILGINIEQ
jgi:cyclophilin family peptidyl-prolyl cis-trans isomerase